jgi:hypothetical protein
MGGDWTDRHLDALRRVGDIATRMGEQAPATAYTRRSRETDPAA